MEQLIFLVKHRHDDFYKDNSFLVILAKDREEVKRKAKQFDFPGDPDNWIVEHQTDIIQFTSYNVYCPPALAKKTSRITRWMLRLVRTDPC